jgi:hypothetical protein
MTPVAADAPLLHELGAVVRDAPESLTDEDRAHLEALIPLSVWREDYNCLTSDTLQFDPRFPREVREPGRVGPLRGVWLRQALHHPWLLAKHILCSSSHVWRVQSPGPQSLVPLIMEPNAEGIELRSKWPAAHRALLTWQERLSNPAAGAWWLWRTPAWMYLAIFVAIVAAARLRSAWVLLWLAAPLFNSLILVLASPAQDFRYQYPMHLVGLLSSALLFVRRLK